MAKFVSKYQGRRNKLLQTSSNKVWNSAAANKEHCMLWHKGMPQMYAPQLLINLPSCGRPAAQCAGFIQGSVFKVVVKRLHRRLSCKGVRRELVQGGHSEERIGFSVQRGY
jgi:hypothetical protein